MHMQTCCTVYVHTVYTCLQKHLEDLCVTVQCVPVGSCSVRCCGSEWSSPSPRCCRTVRRVYSRSRSSARWTPLLLDSEHNYYTSVPEISTWQMRVLTMGEYSDRYITVAALCLSFKITFVFTVSKFWKLKYPALFIYCIIVFFWHSSLFKST